MKDQMLLGINSLDQAAKKLVLLSKVPALADVITKKGIVMRASALVKALFMKLIMGILLV